MNNGKLLAYAIILIGAADLLYITDIFNFSGMVFAGYILIVYGIANVFINLGFNKRGWLMFGNSVFFTGLSIILFYHFDIMQRDFHFMMIFLFTLSSGFLLIFIENTKEKLFLGISLALFIFALLTERIVELLGKLSMVANLGWILLGYWPIFLILFGTAVLASRKK